MNHKDPDFTCSRCGQASSHYCREMCRLCYQRYLRQRSRGRGSAHNEPGASSRRKRNDYPFKSSKVGEQYQVSFPPVEVVHPSLSKVSSALSEEADFLAFCKKAFADCPMDGDILKGASGFEERALQLLHRLGDPAKAKLAVLRPVQLALDPGLLSSLDSEQIMREVEEGTSDLRKVKRDSKEEVLEKIKKAVDQGISSQELQTLMQVATNMRIALPTEIVTYLTEAQDFSTQLKKTLKQRSIPLNELQGLVGMCKEYKVQTSEMQRAAELLARCEQWAQSIEDLKFPTQKQLQALCSEAATLPVQLPQLATLQEKHARVKKWIENANQVLKALKNKHDTPRTSLAEVEELLSEAQYLAFSHPDVHQLERTLEKTQEWRERATMASEDKTSESLEPPEPPVDLSDNKTNNQWANRARKLLESKVIQQKLLTQLDNEARAKGVTSYLLKDVQKLLQDSRDWREAVKLALNRPEGAYRQELEDLLSRGLSIPTDIEPYQAQLRARLSGPNLLEEGLEVGSIENEWISEAQSVLQQLPRDHPRPDELPTLKKVISACPPHLKAFEELVVLNELLRDAEQWSKQCMNALKGNDYKSLKSVSEKARHVFVNSKMFKDLQKRLRTFEWEAEATEALRNGTAFSQLESLRAEGVALKFDKHPVFLQLRKVLSESSSWFEQLEAICNQGTIEELEELYRGAPATLSLKQRSLLRMTLISMYIWTQRAQLLLTDGGNYHELKTLISEGDMICFESEELNQLHSLYFKLKAWRARARAIILVRPVIKEEPVARMFKKQCVEEQYLLHKTDNMMEDLISAVEQAPCVEIPSVAHSFPMYHPTEGLSIVVRRKRAVIKEIKQVPTKSRQTEEMRNKRPPKYPRMFEEKEEFCICRTELSWTDSLMICCDCCGEWYHPTCLRIPQQEVEKLEQFICTLCYERAGIRVAKENKNTVNFEFIDTLIAEANEMNIHMHETDLLNSLRNHIQEWVQEANLILNTGVQISALRDIIQQGADETPQIVFDTKVMRLINQHESFPVQRPERDLLLMLLRKRDWVKEAFKCIYVRVSPRNAKKLIKDQKDFDEEIEEVAKELEDVSERANDINNTIQLLSSKQAGIEEYKEFLSGMEPAFLKMEKVEKIKKKIDSLENLHIEISRAPTDFGYLKDINDRARKIGIASQQTNEIAQLFQAFENWVERAGKALETSASKEDIQHLLKESQEMGIRHLYIRRLEDKLGK